MLSTSNGHRPRIYKFRSHDGRRFLIYNAAEIGNPPGHLADKWYLMPYPIPPGREPGEPFDTAEAAERAANRGAVAVAV